MGFGMDYGGLGGFGGFGGFGARFDMFSIMFTIMFVVVIGAFVVTAIRGIGEWNKNNHSPRLTVEAEVVSRRMDVSHRRHRGAGNHRHTHTSTHYYVTFQVASGDRMEFHVSGQEYGLLVEGDRGTLSFQGTRYLNFERE